MLPPGFWEEPCGAARLGRRAAARLTLRLAAAGGCAAGQEAQSLGQLLVWLAGELQAGVVPAASTGGPLSGAARHKHVQGCARHAPGANSLIS